MNAIITKEDVSTLINMTKGSFFGTTFIKKNGSIRKMVARKGVHKHLKGGKSTTNHISDLITVFEPKEKSYKCFSTNRVKELRMFGHKFIVK